MFQKASAAKGASKMARTSATKSRSTPRGESTIYELHRARRGSRAPRWTKNSAEGAVRGGGEVGTRFFRGRDFETCLSALKSREIEEWRPKPSGQDRVRRLRQLG
ncbi:uncharacterized protein LOC113465012 [Ceratina calcarata]|uniref:Uncharacterized protein LOC113465012 n=1 Tax=Ceratina calcarata TaxID=156304 RepID=A0AAJ7S9F0_9HYME|nr:uncharacterized protein LOC113465012 [Ceratina calcarata]